MNYSRPWRGLGTTTKHEYLKSMNTLIIMIITAYFTFFGSFVFGICASLGEEKKLLRFSCVYININTWKLVNHFFIIKMYLVKKKIQIISKFLDMIYKKVSKYANFTQIIWSFWGFGEKSVYRWIHEYWILIALIKDEFFIKAIMRQIWIQKIWNSLMLFRNPLGV